MWHEVVASVELFCVLGISYGGKAQLTSCASCAFAPGHGDVDWGLQCLVEMVFCRVGGLGAEGGPPSCLLAVFFIGETDR